MESLDKAPQMHRIARGFDRNSPELSIPYDTVDAMTDAHQQDIREVMASFALGGFSEDDLRYFLGHEGATLYFPATPGCEPATMKNIDGKVEVFGDLDDTAESEV